MSRDVDLVEQIGRDIFYDLVDHDKVRAFRVQKQMRFCLFKVLLMQQKHFVVLFGTLSLSLSFSFHLFVIEVLISSPVNFLSSYLCVFMFIIF